MDPAANAAKRRILANHLRESIDVLEAKVRTGSYVIEHGRGSRARTG
jgi:hypothetical protein